MHTRFMLRITFI